MKRKWMRGTVGLMVATQAMLALVGTAHAEFITPVSETLSEQFSGRPATTFVNEGLSEQSTNATHDGNSGNCWLSATDGVIGDETVTFDLGAAYDLTKIYIWNYNENHTISESRNLKNFTVEVSTNGSTWVYPTTGTNQTAASIGAGAFSSIPLTDTLDMTASGVRYVRFNVASGVSTGNYGDASYVGIADVAFESVGGDLTPPTVAGITDDAGLIVSPDTPVIYTVTFSETIKASTVAVGDFTNALDAPVTINSVSPGADTNRFTVTVTPTGAGNLQLRVKSGSVTDLADNALAADADDDDDDIVAVAEVDGFITPVAAVAVDEELGTAASATYGQGLTGTNEAATHNGVSGDNWMCDAGLTGDEWIYWDLGATYDLTVIYLWNYCENHATVSSPRGINQFTVEVSTDANTWVYPTRGTNQTAAAAPAFAPVSVQARAMTANGVRYVRFTIAGGSGVGNHGDGSYVGIADVAFGTAPPPPAGTVIIIR